MIAFVTDWGCKNYYTGVAKAVIKRINPDVEIIDLVHGIEPFNVRMAAYMLGRAVNDFPKGTIFLVVVDQGVGTSRKAIAFETEDGYFFVGPDNGVFTIVIDEHGLKEMRELANKKYYYKPKASYTFHGRDIFAPVAAHLSLGVSLKEFGPIMPSYEVLKIKKSKLKDGKIHGELAYYDGFGNLETNIPGHFLEEIKREIDETLNVKIGKKQYKIPYVRAFGDVNVGDLLLHIDSSGFVEIAVNQGSAKDVIKENQGAEIIIW